MHYNCDFTVNNKISNKYRTSQAEYKRIEGCVREMTESTGALMSGEWWREQEPLMHCIVVESWA